MLHLAHEQHVLFYSSISFLLSWTSDTRTSKINLLCPGALTVGCQKINVLQIQLCLKVCRGNLSLDKPWWDSLLIVNYLSHFTGSDSRDQPQTCAHKQENVLRPHLLMQEHDIQWVRERMRVVHHCQLTIPWPHQKSIRDKAQTLLQLVLLGLEPPPNWLPGRLCSLYEAVSSDRFPYRWAVDFWWQLTTIRWISFSLSVRPILIFSQSLSCVRPRIVFDESCAQTQQLKQWRHLSHWRYFNL